MDRATRRPTLLAIAAGVAIGIALAVLSYATASERSPGRFFPAAMPNPPADGAHGIVIHGAENPGLTLLGWDAISASYRAEVAIVPPDGCAPEGADRIEPSGPCAGIPAWGEIVRRGTTPVGAPFVVVSVNIDRACYDRIRTGLRWYSMACLPPLRAPAASE